MALEVTWIHHWKKKGNNNTLTRPFRVRAVQGLSGLALLNVDPEKIKKATTSSKLRQKNGYIPYLLYKAEVCRLRLKSHCHYLKKKNYTMGQIIKQIKKKLWQNLQKHLRKESMIRRGITGQKRNCLAVQQNRKNWLSFFSSVSARQLFCLIPFCKYVLIFLFFEKIKWNLKSSQGKSLEEINVQRNRLLKRKKKTFFLKSLMNNVDFQKSTIICIFKKVIHSLIFC